MSQTFINPEGQPIGVAGQLYDNAEVVDILSGFSAETVNEIPFGCGVVVAAGTVDGYKLPSTSGDIVGGLSVFDFNHMPAGNLDPSGNPTGDLGSVGLKPHGGLQVGRKGRYLVPIDAGITIARGDRPFLRFRTDGASNTQPGTWSNAQDGGTNLIDCTRLGVFQSGVFATYTATGGSANVAVLEVDFTSRNT